MSAGGTRRLFIAVPLATGPATAVRELVGRIRAEPGGDRREVRWVRLDGLHLTIRYLGPTAEAKRPTIEAAVADAAAWQAPFRVMIDGAGAFPSAARPRVLWLGVADGKTELAMLARALDERLVAAGWPSDDRPFTPHLTIARSDGVRDGPRIAGLLMERAGELDAAWQAERLLLYESVSGQGPARYVPLLEAPFGG